MAATPEGRVKSKLDKAVKKLMLRTVAGKPMPIWYFNPIGGAYGKAGIPDKMYCVAGMMVGVEVKADSKKKPTALQRKCMSDIEAAGGKCFVVYDDDTIVQFIREVKIMIAKKVIVDASS